VDGQTIEQFDANLEGNLYKIYFPPPVRAVTIPKKSGGERILGVPTVGDRIAQIQAHPNLKGIFGANEGSAEGAAIGVKESGKKLVLIGYDSGKEQKDAIMSGLMAGAITQNPIGIGKCVVDSAVKALKGEKLPKVIDTGFYWYDKTNITDPKIAAVLYD